MIVVKFGGHAMKDENGNFAKAISGAITSGEEVVVVHGGGPQIDAELSAREIVSTWLGGFRVTTQEIFQVVEQVLVHQVGPEIANNLNRAGLKAVAISARTLPTIVSKRRTTLIDGTFADLGYVGDVVSVNPTHIRELIDQGFIPVIAPISSAEDLMTGLNVNADFAAAAIAAELGASALIVMTDVAGIYRNWPDIESLIEKIAACELESIKSEFAEGMAPKVQAALDALSFGVQAVRIIDGRDSESFAQALSGSGGTLVVA
jgi:acetylglutamate kinase